MCMVDKHKTTLYYYSVHLLACYVLLYWTLLILIVDFKLVVTFIPYIWPMANTHTIIRSISYTHYILSKVVESII